jgi:aminoglycoside 6'-N-acetyltransferase I
MEGKDLTIIRSLRDEDWSEWLRLRCALWPDDKPMMLEQEMIAIHANIDQEPVFVAERPGGRLCGMIEISIRDQAEGCQTHNVGYIEGWYVEPAWRRQGVGRRLVEQGEAWARAQGCIEIASDTTPAYPLSPAAHQRLGYEVVQQTTHFRKRLAP